MIEANKKVVESIKRAANLVGSGVDAPSDLSEDLPINIYLIGQPHLNMFGVLNSAFEDLIPLNRSFMHGYECLLHYGEEKKILLGDEVSSAEKVAEHLSGFDVTGKFIDIQLPDEKLKAVNFHYIASDSDYANVDWMHVKTDADYCLFFLSATALLSLADRKVLRSELMPLMNNRLGIVLANANLIFEADRSAIDSSLERFFQGKNTIYSISGEEGKLISDILSLPEHVTELRHERAVLTEHVMSNNAVKEIDVQIEVLSDDAEKLDDAIQLMNEKAKNLTGRQESACRRMRMQYTSPLKINASKEISEFRMAITNKLHEEINAASDISSIQNMLPNYIKDQWDKEADRISDMISKSGQDIQSGLQTFIENDIREFISEGTNVNMVDYVLRLTDIYADKEFNIGESSFNYEQVKGQSNIKRYGVLASGIALALFHHPIIGAAVAIFGSKKMKKLEEKKAIDANKQELIKAADEMCHEAYDDMMLWLDEAVSMLDDNIEGCVTESYEKLMASIVKALNNKKNNLSEYNDQLEELRSLKSELQAFAG